MTARAGRAGCSLRAARAGRAARAIVVAGFLALALAGPVSAADPAGGTTTDGDPLQPYIELITDIRGTLDQSLAEFQAGDTTGAFAAARKAYLDSFELVEVPLRQRDPDMTLEMENAFAVMRADIKAGQPVAVVTDDVARLQNGLDDVERTLSLQGYAPLVVAGTSFVIVLRGGLESVILIGSILGYLAAARASHMRMAVFAGVASALGATAATWLVLQTILRLAPIRPSLVQAIPALVAVVVLVVFAYWLLARLDRRRWLEFMSAKVFTAVAAGSAAALFLLGFTAVYRQGFESVAFFQALLAYSRGLETYLVVGAILALLALAGLTVLIFRLGRAVPVTAFLAISIVLVMAISVAFLGNAVRGLQEAYVIPITNLTGSLPRLPIYLAQATGYHPTTETLVAQGMLILAYVITGAWVVVMVRRRRHAADARSAAAKAARAAAATARATASSPTG